MVKDIISGKIPEGTLSYPLPKAEILEISKIIKRQQEAAAKAKLAKPKKFGKKFKKFVPKKDTAEDSAKKTGKAT